MPKKVIMQEPVLVEKFIFGGQSLGTLKDGKKIFFWNALPGETVTEFEVTKTKSHFVEAIALKIDNPSPHRIAPADSCFLSTSPWQILDYDYELVEKSNLIKELFGNGEAIQGVHSSHCAGYGRALARSPRNDGRERRGDDGHLELPHSDNKSLFYRNKMEYALYWDNETEKISLAFHKRGAHSKIPISKSSIERPEIFKKAAEIVADLNKNHAEARTYQSLLLRCDQKGNISGGLYENGKPHPDFPPLTDTILGYEYSYSPNGFFQINLPVYEMALTEIKRHIKTKKVLDLYSGVGTIGLSVARDCDLTLVECDKSAYKELENNVKNTAATPVLARSEDALNYITKDATVILDPPRAGCHTALLDRLLEQQPPTIIYLSCNPVTQARDAKILAEKYKISSLATYNFFPRTPHIENLLILEQK